MDRPRPLGSSPVINVVDAFPTDADLIHLARCVELAQQARDAGNPRSAPYWSAPTGPCWPKQATRWARPAM